MGAYKRKQLQIERFDFTKGDNIAGKYQVVRRLGAGWEGEVFLIREKSTGIERAAKVFYPHRNPNDKTSRRAARKLHKLRHSPVVLKYHTQESFIFKGVKVSALISEFVDGEILTSFLKRQKGKRLSSFEGAHLLHALAKGIETIHQMDDYHGDLHADNVFVRKVGLGFQIKLIDMFHWGTTQKCFMHDDICDIIKLYYEAVGGKSRYPKQPPEVKSICRGLKRSLILKKFRTASHLRHYLETIPWG